AANPCRAGSQEAIGSVVSPSAFASAAGIDPGAGASASLMALRATPFPFNCGSVGTASKPPPRTASAAAITSKLAARAALNGFSTVKRSRSAACETTVNPKTIPGTRTQLLDRRAPLGPEARRARQNPTMTTAAAATNQRSAVSTAFTSEGSGLIKNTFAVQFA